MQQQLPDPTRAEYEILKVLWNLKEASIREVHDQLRDNRNWAYSTTKTTMDRMTKKGLLHKASYHGVYIYKPLISKPAGLAKMVKFFADHVLELNYNAVVNMFAESDSITSAELKELSVLLNTNKSKRVKNDD